MHYYGALYWHLFVAFTLKAAKRSVITRKPLCKPLFFMVIRIYQA
jgi:hypothetical protein